MALIYIVEDDENIREIETIALKNSNYMVCAFEKATTFYKKLEDIIPALIRKHNIQNHQIRQRPQKWI